MSERLTISGISRALACPAAYALPVVRSAQSADASRGTQVHRFLELVATNEPTSDYRASMHPDARKIVAGIDLADVPTSDNTEALHVEVPVAWDVVTGAGRILPSTGQRDYSAARESEIPGTADVIYQRGGRWYVRDWKTAAWDHDVETSRPQLDTYALAWARAHNLDAITCEVVVIEESGAFRTTTWEHDWESLAAHAARVRAAVRAVEAARTERYDHEERSSVPWTPDVTTGAHCRYCAAFLACPATRNAVTAMIGGDPATLRREDLGAAYVQAKAATQAADAVIELAREQVRGGDLPTGEGRVLTRTSNGSLRLVKRTQTTGETT